MQIQLPRLQRVLLGDVVGRALERHELDQVFEGDQVERAIHATKAVC